VSLVDVLLLGAVQGLTEFLPVSSDGHLALFQNILGMKEASLALDVALHAGTLVATFLFFRKDILQLLRGLIDGTERRRALYVVIATFFTGVIGLSLKKTVEASIHSLPAAGVGFLFTVLFLIAGEWGFRRAGPRKSLEEIPWWHMALLGIVQGLAVWPGWSRSGSTIGLALALGWKWEEAGRFSFVMAIPAVTGALLLMAKDMRGLDVGTTLAGTVVSFFVGCAALALLMRFLAARRLWPFAVYCAALGAWALFR